MRRVDAAALFAYNEVRELFSILFLSNLLLNDFTHVLVVVHYSKNLFIEDALLVALEAAHEVVVGTTCVERVEKLARHMSTKTLMAIAYGLKGFQIEAQAKTIIGDLGKVKIDFDNGEINLIEE